MDVLVGILLLAAQEPPEFTPPPPGTGAHTLDGEEVGFGPVQLTSLSPFPSFRPGFAPRTPVSLPAGALEVRLSETWADVWAHNQDDWILDYEALRSNLTLSYGLTDSWTVGVELETIERIGGGLDQLILGFHDTVGAEQRHRDDFPTGQMRFDFEPRNGTPLSLTAQELERTSQSILFSVQHRWGDPDGGDPAFSVGVSVRRQLQNVDVWEEDGQADVGLSAAVAQRWGDVHGYLAVSFGWFGHDKLGPLEFRPTQLAALAAVEWRFSSRASVVFQYLLTQGILETPDNFKWPSSEVALGFKYRVRTGVLLEIAAVENLIIPDNSPDFGLHAGLTFRW